MQPEPLQGGAAMQDPAASGAGAGLLQPSPGARMSEAIDLARLMLEHAKAGCWEEVARVNVQSRAFSSEALSRLAAGVSHDDHRLQVAELLGLLGQIRSLAESRREKVKLDLIGRTRGKAALAQYGECQDGGLQAA